MALLTTKVTIPLTSTTSSWCPSASFAAASSATWPVGGTISTTRSGGPVPDGAAHVAVPPSVPDHADDAEIVPSSSSFIPRVGHVPHRSPVMTLRGVVSSEQFSRRSDAEEGAGLPPPPPLPPMPSWLSGSDRGGRERAARPPRGLRADTNVPTARWDERRPSDAGPMPNQTKWPNRKPPQPAATEPTSQGSELSQSSKKEK